MRARFVGRWYPPSVREPGPIFVFCARLVQLFLCANQGYLYYYRLVAQRLVSDGFVWLRDGCAKHGWARRASLHTSRSADLSGRV